MHRKQKTNRISVYSSSKLSIWPDTVFTFTWPDRPLANPLLSKQFGPWPIFRTDWLHRPTEAVGEEELPVLQLLIRAIALTGADLVRAETLKEVVDRVVTTAQVAAVVAQWEGRRVHLTNTGGRGSLDTKVIFGGRGGLFRGFSLWVTLMSN